MASYEERMLAKEKEQDERIMRSIEEIAKAEKERTPEPDKVPFYKEVLSLSIHVLVVLCVSYLIITFVGQRTLVDGSSMEPTMSNGEHLIVDKITYRFAKPNRYDIIVFPHGELFFIKRIIGLPGETVYIDVRGNIWIDGEVLEESFGKEVITNPGRTIKSVTLGDNEYFVLGDNRNNSMDSRDPRVGNIPGDIIVGKAWIRIYPFSKFGRLRHT